MITVRIHSPHITGDEIYDFFEFNESIVSKAVYTKTACSGGYTVGNVAIGQLKISVPRYQYNEQSKVQFFRDGSQIHGDFYVERRQATHRGKWLEITCYDALYAANDYLEFPESGGKEIETGEIMDAVCEKLGITWDHGCSGYYYPREDISGKKMIEILGIIGSDHGGNFAMRGNVLCFIPLWYAGTTYTVTKSEMVYDDFNLDYQYFTKIKMGDYTAGTDGGEVLTISSDYADESKCQMIQSNISGIPYKPFTVKRAMIQDDVDIGDKIVFITDRKGVEYKPQKISAVYTSTGCYAALSADRSAESRSEFQFDGPISREIKKKLSKNKKYGSVKIGDYGFKSVSVKPSNSSTVGAKAADITEELRIDDAEIRYSDATDTENPVEAGKIYLDTTDTENKSVNIAMKGLLTEAQDVRGAINELFQSGTGDDWVRPEWWIPLPDPEPNQVTMLMYITEEGQSKLLELFRASGYEESENNLEATVDYGDGSPPETKNSGNDIKLVFGVNNDGSYQPWAPGQYIVTITFHTLEKFYPIALYGNLIGYADVRKKAILGLKVGSNISRVQCLSLPFIEELYFNCENMTKIEDRSMNNFQALRRLKLPSSITAIGNDCFQAVRVLKHLYLPNLESIGSTCFIGSFLINSIAFPKLKTIGGGSFSGAFGIENIDLPVLETMGNNCFSETVATRHINIPSTATIGTGCFPYLGYGCPPEERPI